MSRKLGTSSQASPESSALREAALRAVRETQPDNTRDSETLSFSFADSLTRSELDRVLVR